MAFGWQTFGVSLRLPVKAEDMAQMLRELAVLSKELSSVPTSGVSQAPVALQDTLPSSSLQGAHTTYIDIHTHTDTIIKINFTKFF